MSIANFSNPCGVDRSISGKTWIWRGGNMSLDARQDALAADSLVRQLLMSRGIDAADVSLHLQPTLRSFLPDPSIFRDMDAAVDRIVQAILTRETVTIYGDYDVDGATSAAVLIRLFAMLGHCAGYYIPDRLLEGYGPSGEALVHLARQGSTLVITVDCGAMAHDALARAHETGLDVVVVDHHKCDSHLPKAVALVNPNRLDEADDAAEHRHLAAVGMVFLVAVAVTRALRERGYFTGRDEPDLLSLLDLVALGTVADVAALRGLNRAFVAQGLKVMARRENIGLAALLDAARLSRSPRCSDLGFALGPRINAGGRVGESTLGVRLLTTGDPEEARHIAEQLSHLNEERRAIERFVQDEAEAQLPSQRDRAVCVVHAEHWHPGVIGIVAGRIKEKTGRPAFVIAIDPETGLGKGSGRSISGVDMGAAVLAAKEAGLLVAGGGHAMAAGLTIQRDSIELFAAFVEDRLNRRVAHARLDTSLAIDLSVAPRGLLPELVEQLESAGPYGMGWPSPRLAAGPVRLLKCEIVGSDHVRLIAAGDDGARFKAIAFGARDSELGQTLLHAGGDRRLWLAGRVKIDDWGAMPVAELHLEDAAFAKR